MTLDLGTLVGYLEMDPTKWDQGFDAALRTLREFPNRNRSTATTAGRQVGESLGEGLAPAAREAGEEGGESLGDGLLSKGKLAAAGAAVAISAAFVEALNFDASGDKLAASLGATPHRAKMYGDLAGKLYSGAWGESLEDVNDAIGTVVSSLRGMRHASEGDLEKATIKALDFANAFDVDVSRAVNTAGIVLNSGLAKNATQAFDLITAGSQKVPAELREDLLDALDEYSQFFHALGYTGPQALGMLVKASDKGMYGIDKMGDAVKEFTIRSTDMSTSSVAAYKAIGLDAQEMADQIVQGGDSAQEATQKVIDGLLGIEDPARRSNLAIALFGTPLEDLNVTQVPAFLRGLRGMVTRMDDVSGASKRMGDTINDNAKTSFTEFKRTVETDLVTFLEDTAIPAIENFADSPAAEHMMDALRDAGDDLKPFVKSLLPALASGLDAAGDALGVAAPLAKQLFDSFNSLPDEVKTALVVGGGAALLAKKTGVLGGARSLLTGGGGGGGILGKASPVPVFVVNEGFGGPGGGPGKGKGGIIPWLTGALMIGGAAATAGTVAQGKDIAEMKTNFVSGDFDTKGLGILDKIARQSTGVKGGLAEDIATLDAGLAHLASKHYGKAWNAIAQAQEKTGLSAADLAQLLPHATQKLDDMAHSGEHARDGAHALKQEVFGLKPEVEGLGVKARGTADDTDRLNRILDQVPPKTTAKLDAPGLWPALQNAQRLRGLLDGLDGRVVRTFIRTTQDKNAITPGDDPRFPGDGPATAGGALLTRAAWVYGGEHGPEVIRPLADDLRMRQAAGQRPTAVMPRHVQFVVHDRTFEAYIRGLAGEEVDSALAFEDTLAGRHH